MKAVHLQSGRGEGQPDAVSTWLIDSDEFDRVREVLEEAFGPPTCNMVVPWPEPEHLQKSLSRVIVQSDLPGFEEEFARQARKI